MDPVYVLQQLGGFADASQLRRHCSKKSIARAVREDRIILVSKGKYAVPGLDAAWREAHRLQGVVSGRSAAQFWGLSLRLAPGEKVTPVITVPYKRKVPKERRVGVHLRWRDLPAHGVLLRSPDSPGAAGRVTTLVQTVIDCCRDLPDPDALCVVDAALREGVPRQRILTAARGLSVKAAPRVIRLVESGDKRSANAFESCLREIVSRVAGLRAVPQFYIGEHRVDLADERLRIVIEAESFAFHGSKEMFRLDCRRYTGFVVDDWMVLRFVWEDVVLAPEKVRAELERAVALRQRRMQAA